MKKFVFFMFCFMILVNSHSSGQIINGYGVKLGVTSAYQNWDYKVTYMNGFDSDKRLGINAGMFLEFLNSPFFSINAEIDYNQKGMKKEVAMTSISFPEGTGEYKTDNNRIDYLTFALLGKLSHKTSLFKPYIFAGPRMDLQINKSVSKGWEDVFDKMKKNVYGISFGIGTEMTEILPITLLAEIEYNYDFTDVYETDNLVINNNSFDVKLGVKF